MSVENCQGCDEALRLLKQVAPLQGEESYLAGCVIPEISSGGEVCRN